MQNSQQQMLLVNLSGTLDASLEDGQFQNVACLFVEYQFAGADGHTEFVVAHAGLQLCLYRLDIDVQPIEHAEYKTVLHAHQS